MKNYFWLEYLYYKIDSKNLRDLPSNRSVFSYSEIFLLLVRPIAVLIFPYFNILMLFILDEHGHHDMMHVREYKKETI
jgi:hypothetical protein